MTRAEAQRLARERWGKAGDADRRSDAEKRRRFVVGVAVEHPDLGEIFQVRGAGATYEDAFNDAELHADVEPQQMPRLGHLYELAKATALHELEQRKTSGRQPGEEE